MTNEQAARLAELRKMARVNHGRNISPEERKELSTLSRLEISDDKALFGENYDWMSALLFRHDPVNLVGCGVPKDEYDLEGRKILHLLHDYQGKPSVSEVQKMTFGVFDRYFNGHAGDLEDYNELAQEIYDNLNRLGK